MKTKTVNGRVEVVDQTAFLIPDLSIKELLSAIPCVSCIGADGGVMQC